jgi:hypothetical protein
VRPNRFLGAGYLLKSQLRQLVVWGALAAEFQMIDPVPKMRAGFATHTQLELSEKRDRFRGQCDPMIQPLLRFGKSLPLKVGCHE